MPAWIHADHWLANQAICAVYPAVRFYVHPVMIEQANADRCQHAGTACIKRLKGNRSGDSRSGFFVEALLVTGDNVLYTRIVRMDDASFRSNI